VLANANTGLAADDVFYLANVVGDCDGDGEVGSSDCEAFVGEFGLRGGIDALVADLNGDRRVDLGDFAIMRGARGNSVSIPTFPAAAPGLVVESGLDALAVPAAVTSVNPGAASDQPPVISDQLVLRSELLRRVALTAIDLLMPSLTDYISDTKPISVGAPLARPYREAAGEYSLRPLSADPGISEIDDLLVDLLEATDFSSL